MSGAHAAKRENPMPTREELIRELDASYQDYLATVGGLDERQFEKKWLGGQWGTREISAHITGWMLRMGAALEQMARGEKPDLNGIEWTEFDELNTTFARDACGKKHEQILNEMGRAIEAFKNAALKLPDERFAEGRTAPRLFQVGSIEHFKEHAGMIREWRASKGV